ncbi:hypothetical protein BD408DRAFT_406492 [Parasitella parasitica]|nr:hypothetical protein BD408DRAFT_406492 [Parasitella parasitica]
MFYNSKRSRKVYSDLADEREFLLHVKELWQTKLASLKEDKTLLERMKDLKKSDLVDVEPLFCPEEKVQGVENDVQEETGPSTSVDTENQENVHDRFKIVNGQVVVKDLDMLATLQELDKIYTGTQNELEQDSSEEEAEEDDEEARKALHRMLEEFGGGF